MHVQKPHHYQILISNKEYHLLANHLLENGFSFLFGDTIISPGSKEATADAVGSIITAIDGVQNKEFQNAFLVLLPW